METLDTADSLSFEKATYETSGDQGTPCANCNGSLGEQYWQWQTRPVCATCRATISETLAASQSKKAFGRAVVLGGLTALGCGIAYAVFVAVTDYQLALLTIGIAFVVAKVLRHCSKGVGGRKYQVLALVLTYFASAMGYAPAIISGFREGADEQTGEAAAAARDASATADAASSSASPVAATTSASASAPAAGTLLIGIAALIAFLMAAPILAATQAPMGLLIVGFGLWEAWKLTQGLSLTLEGPFRVAPQRVAADNPEPFAT